MNNSEFPPPPPQRSPELERSAQMEFYRLQEEGALPQGKNGEPMDLPEFIDRAYEEAANADKTSGKGRRNRTRGAGTNSPKRKQKAPVEDPIKARMNSMALKSLGYPEEVVRALSDEDKQKLVEKGVSYSAAKPKAKAKEKEPEPEKEPEKPWIPSGEEFQAILTDMNKGKRITPAQSIALQGLGYPENVRTALLEEEAERLISKGVYYDAVLPKAPESQVPNIPYFTGAPKNPEPFTPLESQQDLRQAVDAVRERLALKNEKKTRVNSEFERQESESMALVTAAKNEYFEALRNYQRSRTADDALAERLGFKAPKRDEGGEALQSLKRKWIEARAAHARMRLDSVIDRTHGRGYLLENRTYVKDGEVKELKVGKRTDRSVEAIKKRYERRYIAADMLRGAAREEQEFRLKALRDRDVNGLETLWKIYRNAPPALKVALSGAAITGATIAAASAGGLIAAAPLLALGGYGVAMRWAALGTKGELKRHLENRKLAEGDLSAMRRSAVEIEQRAQSTRSEGYGVRAEQIQKTADKKYAEYEQSRDSWTIEQKRLEKKMKAQERASGFSFFGLGSWIADKLLSKAQDSQKRSDEQTISGLTGGTVANKKGEVIGANYSGSNLSDPRMLEEQSEVLEKSYKRRQKDESLRSTIKTGAGFAAGLAGGAAVGAIGDRFDGDTAAADTGGASETGSREDAATDVPDERADIEPREPGTGSGEELQGPAPEAGGSEGAPSSREIPTEPTGSISEAAIRPNSGEGFNDLFAKLDTRGIENPSAVVEHLRNTSPSELSRQIEALVGDESARMRGGDSIVLDENQNAWFMREGEAPRLIFENTGNGEFTTHVLQGVDRVPHVVPEVRAEAPVAETSIEAQDASLPEASAVSAETPPAAETRDVLIAEVPSSESPIIAEQPTPIELADQTPEPPAQSPVATPEVSENQTSSVPEVERVVAETGGSAARPEAPWDFPGISPDEFVNRNNLTIDPTVPTAFVDQGDNVFFFGGTYDQLKAAAEAYAIEHPGTLVSYEGDPILSPDESPIRWTAAVTADENGRVFNPAYPTHEAQMDSVPNPNSFIRRAE